MGGCHLVKLILQLLDFVDGFLQSGSRRVLFRDVHVCTNKFPPPHPRHRLGKPSEEGIVPLVTCPQAGSSILAIHYKRHIHV